MSFWLADYFAEITSVMVSFATYQQAGCVCKWSAKGLSPILSIYHSMVAERSVSAELFGGLLRKSA